jgi:hypothetical protein
MMNEIVKSPEQEKLGMLNNYLNGYSEMLAAVTVVDPCKIKLDHSLFF